MKKKYKLIIWRSPGGVKYVEKRYRDTHCAVCGVKFTENDDIDIITVLPKNFDNRKAWRKGKVKKETKYQCKHHWDED